MYKIRQEFCETQALFAWRYDLTWYTHQSRKVFEEKSAEEIIGLLKESCEELELILISVEITPCIIRLIIETQIKLSTGKSLKRLQKTFYDKVIKIKEISKHRANPFWENRELIMTLRGEKVKEDSEVDNFLKEVTEVAYYDLDECLDEELEDFKAYLSRTQLAIINYGKYTLWIDKKALEKEINLNCFECTKMHRYGCCCGSPCEMSSKNTKLLKKHMKNIEEEMKKLDKDNYDQAVQAGGLILRDGRINEYNTRCALFAEHEGVGKCIIHKYALDKEIAIYDICPLSCLMYPLEILELITDDGRKVFVFTSVVDEYFSEEFGRWGSYKGLDVELRCIHKEKHNEVFKEEEYRPVFKVNEKLIVHEFGREIYKGVEKVFEKTSF